MKRVAVIGAGVGAAHAQAYRELPHAFALKIVCDLNEERAAGVAAQGEGTEVLASFDEVLARRDIDIVDICLPPQLHRESVIRALEAGKDVVCEKPLVGSVAEVDAIEAVSRRTGRTVVPIFQYRFGDGLMKLRRLIAMGLTGKPLVATVSTHWNRLPSYYDVPWRGKKATELGGAIIGHAIHAHDLVTSLLGPVRTVFARVSVRVNRIETEDCGAVVLEMADGTLVTLSVTLGSAEEVTLMRLCYANLTAQNEGREPYHPAAEPWRFIARGETGQAAIDEALAGFVPVRDRYVGLFQAMHEAYEGEGAFPVTLEDARRSLELASAIYYSSAKGEAVSLPLPADHPVRGGWVDWLP